MTKANELARLSRKLNTFKVKNTFLKGGTITEKLSYLSLVSKAEKRARRFLVNELPIDGKVKLTTWLDANLRKNGFCVLVNIDSGEEVFDTLLW